MSNDYTPRKEEDEAFALPPVPYWLMRYDTEAVEGYGAECAKAARAPLLARIAELEAEVNRWREIQAAVAQLEGAGPEWPDHGNAPLAITASYALHKMQADRLRAEVADWRKLLDPANLHVNLLQGKPAKLTRAQLAHLLGQDYTALLAEVEKLREILERLESACNDRAALTTSAAYLIAEAVPGMKEALTRLDDARRDARSMLAQPAGTGVNPLAAEVEKLRAALDWLASEIRMIDLFHMLGNAPLQGDALLAAIDAARKGEGVEGA